MFATVWRTSICNWKALISLNCFSDSVSKRMTLYWRVSNSSVGEHFLKKFINN